MPLVLPRPQIESELFLLCRLRHVHIYMCRVDHADMHQNLQGVLDHELLLRQSSGSVRRQRLPCLYLDVLLA